MEKNNRKVLRTVILPGTSDLDINGVEGDFKGLEYTVYEPIPGLHEIFNEGLVHDDQIWKRTIPPDFSKMSKKECQDYYLREIKRIEYGVYVWIGGVLEYIAGKHYGTMCHWKLKESSSDYAIYTETQRDIFYMFDLCAKDKKSAGAIIFSLKRLGKSELMQAEMYFDALLSDQGRYIVQALSHPEAKDIFSKTIYANEHLHETLPVWTHLYSKKEPPAENLVGFRRDAAKGAIEWKSADGIEGSNEVSFSVKPTTLAGIQGKKLKRGCLDEFASLDPEGEMTLENYHSKLIAQCTEDFGSSVVGKGWLIATAENMESKSLLASRQIWDDSAEDRKDGNGYNISMMKRMFIPYYRGGRGAEFIDKFGRPKIEEAKQWYANKISSMSDRAKAIFRRQNPETIKDVFEIDFDGGLELDVIEILKERRKELVKSSVAQPFYNISKYNGDIRVIPVNSEETLSVQIFEMPQEHHLYRVGVDATSTAVNSTNKTASGKEKGKEKSKFGLVVHRITGDDQYTDVANIFIRPEKRHLIEKVAMYVCQYYNKYGGCRAYPERNASAGSTLTDMFEAEGCQKILIRQLKKHNTDKLQEKSGDAYGIYIDGNNKDYRTSVMNKYLRLHGHKIKSIRVIDNLLLYGLANSDLADAYGVGNMACGNFDPEQKEEKKPQKPKKTIEWVLRDGIFQAQVRMVQPRVVENPQK